MPNASATNTNWPTTSERAVAISGLALRHAPKIGSAHCSADNSSAKISASWPSSGIMRSSRRLRLGNRVGDFAGHVGFVVLGEHLGGREFPAAHVPGGDHALALAKQVGKDAGVFHAHVVEAISDDEIGLQRAGYAMHAALLHYSAEPESGSERRLAGFHFA